MFFFSTECLLKLQELQGSVIECFSCKLRTLLPSNGVDGLDKNMDLLHAILQTEEEEQKLCNFCIRKVYPLDRGPPLHVNRVLISLYNQIQRIECTKKMSAKDTLILKKRLHKYTYDTKRDYAHITC